ncbi:MAG TPA: carboxypeptidase regulatory-like domain-containing protein [Solirubrobacteraceae bacterium]|nr:carboxypeptidase regulatory-like domain-containing protein [Solirubrobacteraceae bacterium]
MALSTAAHATPARSGSSFSTSASDLVAPAIVGTGEVSGTVTAAASSAPLAGIEVCAIEDNAEAFTQCATTGVSGEYVVSGLPQAEYVVEFYSLSGTYATQYYNGKSSIAASTKVAVSEGALTSGVDAAMALAGEITGEVTAKSEGTPIEDIKVCLLGSGSETVLQCTSTKANGEYTLTRLPEGEYDVEFYSPGGKYATQFYSEKSSFAGANKVFVGEGSVKGGIDAAMALAGQITGEVTAQDGGTPLEDIKVCAFATSGEATQCTATKADGEYTLTRLPEAEYVVEFFSYTGEYVTQYFDKESSFAEANKVRVTGGEVASGVDAAMVKTGTITGVVTEAGGGKTLEGIKVCAHEIDYEESPSVCASTNTNGEYSILRLPQGEYIVQFYSPSAKYVTQYYDDKASEAEADEVGVQSGKTTADVDAALEPTVGLVPPHDEEKGPPSISGSPAVGQVLACLKGTWSGNPTPKFRYRWLRDGVSIPTATGETYTVETVDQGHRLECEVTANNGVYSLATGSFNVSARSAPVEVPVAAPASPGPAPTVNTSTATPTTSTTPTGSTTSGTGTTGTGGVANFTGARAPAPRIAGKIKSKSGAVLVPLSCAAKTGSCQTVTIRLTVTEKLTAGKVTGLLAKANTRTVEVGRLTVTLKAGRSETVKVTLNSWGRKLLAAHGGLPTDVELIAGTITLKGQNVLVTVAAKVKR